jgi:uncharacterized protein YllA (UPF0747 family)
MRLEKFIWGRISQARQSSGRHTPISEFTFGTYGLVILDADDADLKPFYSFAKKELLHQTPIKQYLKQPKIKKYNIQVNPREINLFYIEDKIRERIILEEGSTK